jgi:hypothetical protein
MSALAKADGNDEDVEGLAHGAEDEDGLAAAAADAPAHGGEELGDDLGVRGPPDGGEHVPVRDAEAEGSGSTHVPPASSTTGRMLKNAVHRTPPMAPAAASSSWLWHVSTTGRRIPANAETSSTTASSALRCSVNRPPGTTSPS